MSSERLAEIDKGLAEIMSGVPDVLDYYDDPDHQPLGEHINPALQGLMGPEPTPEEIQEAEELAKEAKPDAEFLYDEADSFKGLKNVKKDIYEFTEKINFRSTRTRKRMARSIATHFSHTKKDKQIFYDKKLVEEQQQKGVECGMFFGEAEFDGQKCVIISSEGDFMGGSVGEAEGRKFIEGVQHAEKKGLPIIFMSTSSGMRQQENLRALMQMEGPSAALLQYKLNIQQPVIGIFFKLVYGGTPASIMPMADITYALDGTRVGFSGPALAKDFTGIETEEFEQSGEMAMILRQIDGISKLSELPELLTAFIRVFKKTKNPRKIKFDPETRDDDFATWASRHSEGFPKLHISRRGVQPVLPHNRAREAEVDFEIPESEELDKTGLSMGEIGNILYGRFTRDIGRITAEQVMMMAFDDFVPQYSVYTRPDRNLGTWIKYPPIIGGVALLDGVRLVVVGNNPSYLARKSGALALAPTLPGTEDYKYLTRMYQMATRLEAPTVALTSVNGANPSKENEMSGMWRAISDSIVAKLNHNELFATIILGALGSGGGLASTNLGNYAYALEDAYGYVASPDALMRILLGDELDKIDFDERQQIRTHIIEKLRADAHSMKEQGFIKDVVPTGRDRFETIFNIRQTIRKALAESGQTKDHRAERLKRTSHFVASPLANHRRNSS